MSRAEDIAAERRASANFERRRQERHAREAAKLEAKQAKSPGRRREPQPGQGSIRVTNPSEITWLKSDPRHPDRGSSAPPAAPKLSRFAGVIGEEHKARTAPSHPFASHAQSSDPSFGAPLFRRSQQPVADTRSPLGVEFGPFPAGPRREATPYSGGQLPGLAGPQQSPAEEWAGMRGAGSQDALSDYYSAQRGSPQRAAQDEADAAYRMTAEYRNRKLERLRRQGEAAADFRMTPEYASRKAARLQAEADRQAMDQAILDYLAQGRR